MHHVVEQEENEDPEATQLIKIELTFGAMLLLIVHYSVIVSV